MGDQCIHNVQCSCFMASMVIMYIVYSVCLLQPSVCLQNIHQFSDKLSYLEISAVIGYCRLLTSHTSLTNCVHLAEQHSCFSSFTINGSIVDWGLDIQHQNSLLYSVQKLNTDRFQAFLCVKVKASAPYTVHVCDYFRFHMNIVLDYPPLTKHSEILAVEFLIFGIERKIIYYYKS